MWCSSAGRHKILPSGNLQIEKVRQSDQGIYRCTAYNTETGMKRVAPNRIHLRVIGKIHLTHAFLGGGGGESFSTFRIYHLLEWQLSLDAPDSKTNLFEYTMHNGLARTTFI